MTIPSIAKTLLGVKNIHVESMDMEISDGKPALVIHARPYKREICRCGICGKEAPGYNRGRGMRRWRAPDIGEEVQVYVKAPSFCANIIQPSLVIARANLLIGNSPRFAHST